MIELLQTFLVLWFLHALADFAFQSDAMAQGKNIKNEIANWNKWVHALKRDPKKYKKCWFWWLSAHALIQGGLIFLVFGNYWIFLIEVIAHFTIDFLKCNEKLNPHQDQGLHISLRVLYAFLIVGGM